MKIGLDYKRKLIDISPSVFETLSLEAQLRQTSLKRLIESMLEEAAAEMDVEHIRLRSRNSGIRRLIGSAKPQGKDLSEMEDDRLQYLLSK